MVLFFVFNFLCSFVLVPFPSDPCLVGVCRSGATFDSQPCTNMFTETPGPEMRGSARRRALTRTPHTHPGAPHPKPQRQPKQRSAGFIFEAKG